MSDRLKHQPLDIITNLIPKDKELTEDQISEIADSFYQKTISSLKEENIDLDKLIQIISNNSSIDKNKLLNFFTEELGDLQGNFDEDAYNIQIRLELTANALKDIFKIIVKQTISSREIKSENQDPSTTAVEVIEQPSTTSNVDEAPEDKVTSPTEEGIRNPEQIDNDIRNIFEDKQNKSQYDLLNKILKILPNTDVLEYLAINYLNVSEEEKQKLKNVIKILYGLSKNAEITKAQFETGGITGETLDQILFNLAKNFGAEYSQASASPEDSNLIENNDSDSTKTGSVEPPIDTVDKEVTEKNEKQELINSLNSLIETLSKSNENIEQSSRDSRFSMSEFINQLKYIRNTLKNPSDYANFSGEFLFIDDYTMKYLNIIDLTNQVYNSTTESTSKIILNNIKNLIKDKKYETIKTYFIGIENAVNQNDINEYIEKIKSIKKVEQKIMDIYLDINATSSLPETVKNDFINILGFIDECYGLNGSLISSDRLNTFWKISKKYGLYSDITNFQFRYNLNEIIKSENLLIGSLDKFKKVIESEIEKAVQQEEENKKLDAEQKRKSLEKIAIGLSHSIEDQFRDTLINKENKKLLLNYLLNQGQSIVNKLNQEFGLKRLGLKSDLSVSIDQNNDNLDINSPNFFTFLTKEYLFEVNPKDSEEATEIFIRLKQIVNFALDNSERLSIQNVESIDKFVTKVLDNLFDKESAMIGEVEKAVQQEEENKKQPKTLSQRFTSWFSSFLGK